MAAVPLVRAADVARFAEPAAANAPDLARKALVAQRLAAAATARLAVIDARELLREAREKLLVDGLAGEAIKAAKTKVDELAGKLTASEAALVAAVELAGNSDGKTDYETFTPVYPASSSGRRAALAAMITAKENPLFARVAVNHLWTRHLGEPLVASMFDFGVNGQKPSNPELLDWLSRDFVDNGWDVKRFVKQMVMSGTYRQSSKVSKELAARDPENELLARGPRFRVDAEMVRDNALFISGLLVEKVGGKSVKPYQPAGLWEAVAFQGSNTQNFKQDNGEALYRRGLYTFWKRTSPPPSMMSFDAPSRESCVVRRARTNTPLQALVLMNDQQYVEAARFLAQRMIQDGGGSPEDRLKHGFRLATARVPTATEAAVLKRIFDEHLADFRARKDAAAKLLGVGEAKTTVTMDADEMAAYTMTANLLLNLDETVTKE